MNTYCELCGSVEHENDTVDVCKKLAAQAQEIKTLTEKLSMKTNVDHLHCTTLTCVADELARINASGGKGSGFWKPRAIKAEALIVDLQKSQSEIINSLNNANASLAAKDRIISEQAAVIERARDYWNESKPKEHWQYTNAGGLLDAAIAALPAPQPAQDDHDEDCPCYGDEVQHAPDCKNCECAPSKPVQGQEKL